MKDHAVADGQRASEPDHSFDPVQTIEGICCRYCKGNEPSPRHYAAHDQGPVAAPGSPTLREALLADRYDFDCIGANPNFQFRDWADERIARIDAALAAGGGSGETP